MAGTGTDIKTAGYSLVEMAVIIGIVSILLSIATANFNNYYKRYQSEAQTRMLYADFLSARANALYHRRGTRVKLYRTRFEVYSSLTDGGPAPVTARLLQYPLDVSSGTTVDFDQRGIALDMLTICIDDGYQTGAVDSITVHVMRTRIGKRVNGQACNGENINYE